MNARIAFDDLNATLKATGEETRLRILCLLAEAELTVSELTEILRQSQPRISRHLKLLAEAQLVERFREGSWAFFRRAEHGPAAAVAERLIDALDPDDPIVARDRERPAGVRAARLSGTASAGFTPPMMRSRRKSVPCCWTARFVLCSISAPGPAAFLNCSARRSSVVSGSISAAKCWLSPAAGSI